MLSYAVDRVNGIAFLVACDVRQRADVRVFTRAKDVTANTSMQRPNGGEQRMGRCSRHFEHAVVER
jgi:hypothetical protein